MQNQMQAMDCRAEQSEKMFEMVLKTKSVKKHKKVHVKSSIDSSSSSEDDSSIVRSE